MNANNANEISRKIEEVVHKVDPMFWVPAVAGGQLGELFKFIEKNDLWAAVKAAVQEEKV